MLKVEKLEKSFSDGLFKKKKVLDRISFGLSPCKITGFLGPNGAGKTTTIKIIMGLLKTDKGKIEFNGEEINDKTRKKLGYLPETPSFYPYLKVEEFLYIIGKVSGLKDEFIYKKIDELSTRLFLKEFLQKPIKTLSKGTLQKVAFCQALIGDPEMIILDEPFSGLDPIVMDEIRNYIFSLKKEGKTILISSHMLSEMERICDDVVLINQGRIVLSGNISKLKEKWRIIRALKNEKMKSFLKDFKIEDFARNIIADERETLNLIDLKSLEPLLSKIDLPSLESIFLEAVKFFNFLGNTP